MFLLNFYKQIRDYILWEKLTRTLHHWFDLQEWETNLSQFSQWHLLLHESMVDWWAQERVNISNIELSSSYVRSLNSGSYGLMEIIYKDIFRIFSLICVCFLNVNNFFSTSTSVPTVVEEEQKKFFSIFSSLKITGTRICIFFFDHIFSGTTPLRLGGLSKFSSMAKREKWGPILDWCDISSFLDLSHDIWENVFLKWNPICDFRFLLVCSWSAIVCHILWLAEKKWGGNNCMKFCTMEDH